MNVNGSLHLHFSAMMILFSVCVVRVRLGLLFLLNGNFLTGERVLCFHGPLLYEAKVCWL